MRAAGYALWKCVSEYHGELLHGLVNTLKVSAFAIVGSYLIGIVLSAARAHRIPVISQLTAVYVEVIRNTPILVQIFMIFYGLPQFGILLDQFTVGWVSVMVWGGAFNSENFRAGFLAVSRNHREAALALGFRPLGAFLNVTLPIGGRIALPSSINTAISVVKNTSLMDVIGYMELTTTALNISNLTLQTTEALTVLAIVYLALVWSLSAAIRLLENRLALPEARYVAPLMFPDWAGPVAHYVIHEGLPGTLRVGAIAVVGSAVVGIVLGTLLTVDFRPSRALIRLYIEVFRGLPILVTVFLVFFGLPPVWAKLQFQPLTAAAIALVLWGSAQVAETTRGAVESIPREQHEAAAALGFNWAERHAYVILPQALRRLLPPFVSLLVNIIQNTTLAGVIGGLEILQAGERQSERITAVPPIGLGQIHAFEIFAGVAALFFVISFPLTRLAAYLERRLV